MNFNLQEYNGSIENLLSDINSKLKDYDIKLNSLKNKENIINTMINRTNLQLEKYYEEKNYKLMGVYNGYILTQMEALGQMQEMIIKFEDQIFKYRKMISDLHNNKLNAHLKINVAKEDDNNSYSDLNETFKQLASKFSEEEGGLGAYAKKQLKLEGY
jgi:hypothetical protein